MIQKILEHEDRKSHVMHYEVCSHHIDFKIWRIDIDSEGTVLFHDEEADTQPSHEENHEDAMPFIEGALKWDGCVNLDIPSIHSCRLHFCGPEDDPELGFLMRAIYALGPEMKTWYVSPLKARS